jgi:hypothetical protein
MPTPNASVCRSAPSRTCGAAAGSTTPININSKSASRMRGRRRTSAVTTSIAGLRARTTGIASARTSHHIDHTRTCQCAGSASGSRQRPPARSSPAPSASSVRSGSSSGDTRFQKEQRSAVAQRAARSHLPSGRDEHEDGLGWRVRCDRRVPVHHIQPRAALHATAQAPWRAASTHVGLFIVAIRGQ